MSSRTGSYTIYWPNCPQIIDMPHCVQNLPNDIWFCILDYFRDPEIARWSVINKDEVDVDYQCLYKIGESLKNAAAEWEEQRAKDPDNPAYICVQKALEAIRTNPVIVVMEENNAENKGTARKAEERCTVQWWKITVKETIWQEKGWTEAQQDS